jgi:cell wall assembly regulator SMI1
MLQSISYQGRKLTQEDIVHLERQLEYKIPIDYKRFLLDYNGGEQEPNCHDVQGTEGKNIGSFIDIRWFYSVGGPVDLTGIFKLECTSDDEIKEVYSIEWNYSVLLGRIPANFLPIGCDDGGNQVCISLYGEDEGSIWYWDHNREIIPPDYSNCYKVADNFQALLDGLFEYDYENDVRIP